MNERIRELAEQVVTRFDKDMNGYMEPEELGQWVQWDDLQNLAELIVRECVGVVEGGYWSGGPLGPKRQCTPPEIATMIKEHFGVKE